MKLSFWLSLLIVAAFAGAGYYILLASLPARFQFHGYYYLVIFFIISTAAFHYGLSGAASAGGKHFIRFYMGGTVVKLFLYVFMIALYSMINKAGAIGFALCFLMFYLVFTSFEVFAAYKQFGGIARSEPETK